MMDAAQRIVGDAINYGIVVGTLFDWLPRVAALVSIAYMVVSIYFMLRSGKHH